MARKRGHRSLLRESADPEVERCMWVAIAALRVELLYASIGYGIYAVVSDGRAASAREWRNWLEWVASVVAAMAQEAEELPVEPVESPGWLTQVIERIEAFDQSGAQGGGDPFNDEDVRHWARMEFERLAERARPIEEMAGEPLGEFVDHESSAGMALLGVVQDSLVLALSDDDEKRAMRATSEEILERLLAARKEGVWDVLADL